MIIPSSVTDSITAAGIDVSNDWLSATAPVWNADYSAVLTQPISIAVTPLADMRFLGVTTATITIRISSAPLSLVSWSGIATLVADDTTGGGSPIYPVHNSFTGRDVADTHLLASITGLVDALDGKAPAFVSDGARLFWATPVAGPGLPSLRALDTGDVTGALGFTPLRPSAVSGATDRVAYFTGVNSVGSDSGFRIFKNLGKTYQLRIGDGVTNQGTELGLDSDAANSCFVQCFEAGNMRWSFGRAAPDNAFIISNSGNRPIEIANSATGTIKFGAGGRLVDVVSSLKIGSLAGTLIGTAGNVSALSGTNLVLGNGTTIPQSTFATGGPFLLLSGGDLNDNATAHSAGSSAGGFITQYKNAGSPTQKQTAGISAGSLVFGYDCTVPAGASFTGSNASAGNVEFFNTAGGFQFNSRLSLVGGSKSALNLNTQSTPSTFANGDIWFDGTDIKIRIGGVTKTFTVT